MAIGADDNFADEIAEIFVEEVDEVLDQIDQNFPLWESNAGNDAALKEVRRAFHTLKGSGRMVQADEIGELAWAVENMLNRVIDGTLRANQFVYEIITQVRSVTPLLVKAFQNKQAAAMAGVNIAQLIDQANAIVDGKAVQSLENFAAPEAETQETGPILGDAIPSALDFVELEAVKEELGDLTKIVDGMKRELLTIGTQVDSLSAQLNLIPKGIDPDKINRQLAQADKEIQEMKYFMKATNEQTMRELGEAQKRLGVKVDKELKIVSELSESMKQDFHNEAEQLRAQFGGMIKRWSLGCAFFFSLAVLAISYLT